MNLGKTIHDIRRSQNMTQSQLAEKIGSSQTYLSQIENDFKVPSIEFLLQLSIALRTPLPVIMIKSIHECDIPTEKMQAWREIHDPLMKLIGSAFD